MAKQRRADAFSFIEDDATSGDGLGMAAWGFAAVVAVVLGYASWQFAPATPDGDTVRLAAAPESTEVTGSIAVPDGGTTAQAVRTVGGTRIAPMLLAPPDQTVPAREVLQLRSDIHDLQRRIAQMGLSGDGVSRRLDRLEERLGTLAAEASARSTSGKTDRVAAADPAPPPREAAAPAEPAAAPPPSAPPAPVAAAVPAPNAAAALVQAAADGVRIPSPRPEADAPTITGSVPPKVITAAIKVDREPTAAPAPVAAAPATTPPPPAPVAAAPRVEPAKEAAAPAGPVAALDLGGYRSLVSLKKAWSEMSARYTELGTGIEPLARLHETESGMEARLVVGPYPNQTDAAKGCVRMRALGVSCAVTGYTGQPLAALR